jgi:hypothetical protein
MSEARADLFRRGGESPPFEGRQLGSASAPARLELGHLARIAYIVSAYQRLPQVARLVRRLHSEKTCFAIHVDRKTDDEAFRALVADLRGLSSVHFLDRHICHWGGFGHVRATLKGIDHLQELGSGFDYAILLTGQDYPIKSNEYIDRFLESANGKSFMAFSPVPSASWSPRGGLDRVEYRHLRFYGHHVRLPFKRGFPPGLRAYGGGAYWCLSSECIEYVARFVAGRPDVVSFFRRVDIPDEVFFQTILMSSELAESIVNDNLRYIDWTRGHRPAILGTDDLEALRTSPKLFARKFDVQQDEEVLDLIDRHLLEPGGVEPAWTS